MEWLIWDENGKKLKESFCKLHVYILSWWQSGATEGF